MSFLKSILGFLHPNLLGTIIKPILKEVITVLEDFLAKGEKDLVVELNKGLHDLVNEIDKLAGGGGTSSGTSGSSSPKGPGSSGS